MSTFEFSPSAAVRRIRSMIDHPIIDGDGHLIEYIPVVSDLVAEEADPQVAKRFRSMLGGVAPDRAGFAKARVFWGIPEENTLDRMTATLPRLMHRRMDELGLDVALLYPSFGLTVLASPDDELRQATCRALNRYYAQEYGPYRDRLEPVAVIPLFSPEEAVAELDHAVGTLGLKAIMTSAIIPRPVAGVPGGVSIDTVGHGSIHDYDPFWARCVELGVAPTFHGIGYGWGSRTSATNYVYNHLGNFAVAQEAACRSLVMGGVPTRFPELRFGFLEGGVGWAAQLLADLVGHFDKRNRLVIGAYDPRRFDLDLCRTLLDQFADGRMSDRRPSYEAAAAKMRDAPAPADAEIDDFAESGIESADDIVRLFAERFTFGCEADDPMNALAYDRRLLPGGLALNAMFASDIGHWDVPDAALVLAEAWELVEDGVLDRDDFRAFTSGSVTRLMTAGNPGFFDGTPAAPR